MAEQFGPYRLDHLIGRGGMGEVHRAYDTVRGRTVALKRLPSALADDPEFQARFRRESALAAQLSEPHIIPIHDFGEIEGRLYIDMRLVEGVDLASVIAQHGPMPPRRAVTILAQVAAALDAAHAAGLVHRDVKPSNVLVRGRDEDEFAYLIDFGIARSTAGATTGPSLTAAGATVGTLDYMAPERFGTGPVDGRADVYSLACVLFELLTGRPPYPGLSPAALIHAHLAVDSPRPSTHRPGLAPALDAVVLRGMAKNPGHRHPTAGALVAAARAALRLQTPPPGPPPTPRPVPPHPAAPAARIAGPPPGVWYGSPAAARPGGLVLALVLQVVGGVAFLVSGVVGAFVAASGSDAPGVGIGLGLLLVAALYVLFAVLAFGGRAGARWPIAVVNGLFAVAMLGSLVTGLAQEADVATAIGIAMVFLLLVAYAVGATVLLFTAPARRFFTARRAPARQ